MSIGVIPFMDGRHERDKMRIISQLEVSTVLLRMTAKELGLTQLERMVLIQMSECYPNIRKSHKTIADLIGCSTKTVQRSMGKLMDLGYIDCVKPYSRESNRPAEYRLILDNIGEKQVKTLKVAC